MNKYIGIDLGTSSVKVLLVEADGTIICEESASYDISYPHNGWSEQNPEDWLQASINCINKIILKTDKKSIKGISFGGQMHGLVILDKQDKVIRPCILWNDGRTEKETQYLNDVIGKGKLSDYTGNIGFAGFTAPKIIWLKNNEPENFNRIDKIMLPKDYLAYKFSKTFCTDYSDASGTLLLDVKNKKWSQEMCDLCGIDEAMLPVLYESYEPVGKLCKEYAKILGLTDDVIIAAGAGDNAAAAVGTGTVGNSKCNISLGTSGTVFITQNSFTVDKKNSLHSFCHADGKWHLMGCILSAASCRKWWIENIIKTNDYIKNDIDITNEKSDSVLFLPYLSGERSPHNNVRAKGAFIGVTSTTTQEKMSLAILEGVAFALKDCLEVAKESGINPENVNICGGGAKSKVWVQIVADILNKVICLPNTEQGPSYGAAILAMVACGEYSDVISATDSIVRIKERIYPKIENIKYYNDKYNVYKKLYPILKKVYNIM